MGARGRGEYGGDGAELGAAVVDVSLEFNLLRRPPSVVVEALDVVVGVEPEVVVDVEPADVVVVGVAVVEVVGVAAVVVVGVSVVVVVGVAVVVVGSTYSSRNEYTFTLFSASTYMAIISPEFAGAVVEIPEIGKSPS